MVQLEPEETTRNTGYHGDYLLKLWEYLCTYGAPTCDFMLLDMCEQEELLYRNGIEIRIRKSVIPCDTIYIAMGIT